MLIARANIATPTQGSTIITVLTFYIRLQFERVLLYIYTYTSKQNIRESAQFNITTVSSKVIRQEAARVWSERVSGGCILSYFARDNTISSCSTSGPKAVDTNFIRPARVAFSSTYSLT